MSTRTDDPPPQPSENSIQTTPHSSPQQGSSNVIKQLQHTTQFHTTTPTRQPTIPTLPYTSAQKILTKTQQPVFTISTLPKSTNTDNTHTNRLHIK